MQTMTISLPDQLKEFVDGQVCSGRYPSAADYVQKLILEDEKRKLQDQLEDFLIQGIDSGESKEMTPQDWVNIRREGLKLYEARQLLKRA